MIILARILEWLNRPARVCAVKGHYMWIGNIGSKDANEKLHWPCSRCGKVQVLDYGLQARGHIYQDPMQQSAKEPTK